MLGASKGTLEPSDQQLNGKKLSIGVVQARFNEAVTNALAQACRQELLDLGVAQKELEWVKVPGALEIPLALLAMAEAMKYDALIAIGCVIRGETYHFELVANQACAGVARVSLDYQVPIANAILTTENLAQAQQRQVDKGRDAARVAVEMANLLKKIG